MPVVGIERILSVSSEDHAHLAENLLKADNNKKWKCKAGEKQASVILQLKQESIIDKIDIGNENSAFVEVLVGKSSSPNNDFKVLLVASSLMTMRESKDGTNTSGVRFFKKENLTQPTADEKWDRVKVVCTQPFNKHVQYGLSFVVLHSASSQNEDEEGTSSLGRFALKDEDKDEPVAVGSWFAKRKDPPPPVPPGAAAAIRDASTPVGVAQGKNKKPTPKRPKGNTTPKNGALKPKDESSKKTPKPGPLVVRKPSPPLNTSFIDDEDSPADDTDADSTYSPTKHSTSVLVDDDDDDDMLSDSDEDSSANRDKRPKRTKKDAKNGKIPNAKRKTNDTSASAGSKTKVAKVEQETKPFSRLLEGVTFVISGYQNPLRGELRSKACAMGARYKPDWENSCTHLICAFVNTPKFNQVRGRGKIVKKEWVEECHNRRRRLPWRRFALDRRDAGTSSEEEVWEEGSVPRTSGTTATVADTIASGVNRRRVSSGSDTEEEIQRVRAKQAATKPVTPKTSRPGPSNMSDVFGDDTDVDSEGESRTADLPLPALPDFFTNIVFHIAGDIGDDDRRQLRRYITAYKGSVTDDIDGSVEYVITNLPDVAAQVGEEYSISSLRPDWVWECSDMQKLVSVDPYTL